MSENNIFREVSEQRRCNPEVAVLADGHHFRQFRQLKHFGKGFNQKIYPKVNHLM
jgi:tRNA(His) 5'-end guanylyltransferase